MQNKRQFLIDNSTIIHLYVYSWNYKKINHTWLLTIQNITYNLKTISTLKSRVLIFTLYTYKYHKIYTVYSYTIISDRKNRRHNVCGTTSLYVGLAGGDDGNRTRVRKSIRMNFYECSLLLTFPRIIGNKHPIKLSSLQYTLETQALPQCVHRWSTPKPKPRYSSAGRAALKQLLIQNYCCRLILKRCRFKRWHKPLLAYHVSKSPSKPLHPLIDAGI